MGTLGSLQLNHQFILLIIWGEIMPKLPGYLNVFLNLKKNSVQNYPKGMDDGHLPVWEMMSLYPERPQCLWK